ncbi:MAG: PAS domain-containing sensor histidine kinase [Fidelibacterota bacterium]
MKIIPITQRLDFKLILGVLISLLVVGLPFFAYFYNFHRQQLISGLETSSENLSQVIMYSLESAMLQNEPHQLQEEVEKLSRQSGVKRIVILNNRGKVKFSSDSEMSRKIFHNDTDQECLVCHEKIPRFRKPTTIIKDESGEEIFRSMRIVENREKCHRCHDPNEPLNGIFLLDVSMKRMKEQLEANNKKILGTGLLMVLATGLVLGILIQRLILKRIKGITEMTRRISSGNLNEGISFEGRDEISQLAKSFNVMTASLKASLKELERQKNYLEHVINGIVDEIVVVDRNYKIITVNDAYIRKSGESRETLIGKDCTLYPENEHATCPMAVSGECLASKTFEMGVLQKTLHSYLDKDGRDIFLEIYCSPLKDSKGKVFQVIELRRDITKRKFLEEQLIHTEKLTSIGRLAAEVAHEINNPLDGIQNCLQIIRKSPQDMPKVETMLGLITEGIERIGFMVRRLLLFARHHKLNKELIHINETVEKSLMLIKHKINSQGIQLHVDLAKDLPPINGDSDNLSQVFINILLNACDALEGKSDGIITIETICKKQQSSKMVQVKFTDNGIGIPDSNLERILSPFFSTKDKEKGTGLGLSVSNTIVEEHGGVIQIKSKEAKGTTVEVLFPVE